MDRGWIGNGWIAIGKVKLLVTITQIVKHISMTNIVYEQLFAILYFIEYYSYMKRLLEKVRTVIHNMNMHACG